MKIEASKEELIIKHGAWPFLRRLKPNAVVYGFGSGNDVEWTIWTMGGQEWTFDRFRLIDDVVVEIVCGGCSVTVRYDKIESCFEKEKLHGNE